MFVEVICTHGWNEGGLVGERFEVEVKAKNGMDGQCEKSIE